MDSLNQIGFYQSASTICFGIAIAAAILAVVLFFLLDIREIFMIETGRAQRKTVEEMHARNQRTGKLRDDTEADLSNTGGTTVKSTYGMKTEKDTGKQNTRDSLTVSMKDDTSENRSESSGYGPDPGGGSDGLARARNDSVSNGSGEATEILYNQPDLNLAEQSFRVTQKTIITHTSEVIPV